MDNLLGLSFEQLVTTLNLLEAIRFPRLLTKFYNAGLSFSTMNPISDPLVLLLIRRAVKKTGLMEFRYSP